MSWHDRVGPSVAKLLRESGLSLDDITPSGPRGIITKGDVLAAMSTGAQPKQAKVRLQARVLIFEQQSGCKQRSAWIACHPQQLTRRRHQEAAGGGGEGPSHRCAPGHSPARRHTHQGPKAPLMPGRCTCSWQILDVSSCPSMLPSQTSWVLSLESCALCSQLTQVVCNAAGAWPSNRGK